MSDLEHLRESNPWGFQQIEKDMRFKRYIIDRLRQH